MLDTREVEFDAPLTPLPWGRNVYTVVLVPQDLADEAAGWPTRRVAGHLDDLEVNLGLNRADVVEDTFVYVGARLQCALGLRPGDVVRCRLAPVDPDVVPLAEDVRDALGSAGLLAAFESLPAPRRRQLLVPVDDAARPDTRARRVASLLRAVPEHELPG